MGELLGKSGSEQKEVKLKDLHELLGEKMPDLPKDRIGKFRLNQALHIRFGAGYKNIPMIKNILKEFDDEVSLENTIRANKRGMK